MVLSIVVPLLYWTFNPRTPFLELVNHFLYSWTYSVAIGSFFVPLMPILWVRTLKTRPPLKWTIRVSGTVAGTLAGCLLAGVVFKLARPQDSYWAEFYSSFRLALIISFTCVAFVSLWETHKAQMQASAMELKRKELERERALKLATEAQLSSLESRIHPHFLFNAINTVGSLIPDDPVRAERLLNQMAALLRFSLDSTRSGLVELRQELKVVQDYLDIEQARFAGRVRYSVSVPEELLSAMVPPLSVQTLVENSIKFAVAASRRGASIGISAKAAGPKITISVTDDGPGFTASSLIAGHGLDNLNQRLTMLFQEEARLDIDSGNGAPGLGTRVSFTLPLKPLANHTEAAEPEVLARRENR
jgi:hypothetical protein